MSTTIELQIKRLFKLVKINEIMTEALNLAAKELPKLSSTDGRAYSFGVLDSRAQKRLSDMAKRQPDPEFR